MTVVVQRLTDENQFEEVGRVEDGEITAGEDALTAIDDESVWTGMSPDELTARFDGPRVMAAIRPTDGEREQTEQEAIGTKQTPEGVPNGYVYVSPDEEVGDEYDVVESDAGGTYRSPQPVDEDDDTNNARSEHSVARQLNRIGTDATVGAYPSENIAVIDFQTDIPAQREIASSVKYNTQTGNYESGAVRFGEVNINVSDAPFDEGRATDLARNDWNDIVERSDPPRGIEADIGDFQNVALHLRITDEVDADETNEFLGKLTGMVNERFFPYDPTVTNDEILQEASFYNLFRLIEHESTPEGVPAGYNYLAPGDDPPDGHDVVESPNGATYVSPEPVDDADGDDAPTPDETEDASDRADTVPDKATSAAANEAAAEMEREVADLLGSDPGRDEFEAAESFVADAVAVEEVDFSSFDAAQAETASAELARMNETGELDNIDSFRSSIPETERATDGQMPAHYDRDGRGMSVDPNALGQRANQRLSEAGVTSTPSETHMMEHVAALTEHIESLEEGNGEADEDTTLEEAAEETDTDLGDVAAKVGQLSVATTATLVAETYVMARNGYPQPSQVRRLYRFLGGPELSDFRGGDE